MSHGRVSKVGFQVRWWSMSISERDFQTVCQFQELIGGWSEQMAFFGGGSRGR